MIFSAPSADNQEQGEKQDIYHFGLILMEVITGKPTESQSQLESLKAQVNLMFLSFLEKLKLHFYSTAIGVYFHQILSRLISRR